LGINRLEPRPDSLAADVKEWRRRLRLLSANLKHGHGGLERAVGLKASLRTFNERDKRSIWDHPDPSAHRRYPHFCTPIYGLHDGRRVLIRHPAYKTSELLENYRVIDDQSKNRWPAFIAVGEYRPTADRPIWFSKSKLFMNIDGVPLGPRRVVAIGGYGSLTSVDGEDVYWHPDRKLFLLGKIITDELLFDLRVPESV
jgi:hypothetical protein